jgi:hypothetical protein
LTNSRRLFTAAYPSSLKALFVVGLAWLILSFLGSLYGLSQGIAMGDIVNLFTPNVIFGLALILAATFWKWTIDRRPKIMMTQGP